LSISQKAIAPDLISAFIDSGGEPGELLGRTLNVLPDPLLVFDTAEGILFANAAAAAWCEQRHLSLDKAPGRFWGALNVFDSATQNLLTPERLPLARALRGETVDHTRYLIRPLRHSSSFWIECSVRAVHGWAAGVRGAVVVLKDITETMKRELALESAEQLRDFIYHGNLAGILHSTIDGRIIDCNEAIVRMFGYSSKKELLDLRAPQLYYDPPERDRLIGLIGHPRELREREVCFRRRDNSRCWGLVNVRLLDPPPGQVGGSLVSTVIDITERKLSEETLRQSEQRFTAFMGHLPGIAFIKDPFGKYVYHNEASWPLFAKHPADIVGKTDEDLWPGGDAARYRANDATVLATGRPLECLEPMEHADGTHTWLIYKFPILEGGKVALVGGVGIDVTERQSLEEQLTQARKMEALGRLAGGVAHDFNNLLTVISGYAQLALEGLGSTSPERMTTYMQEILNSSRRASGLTGQLLAFSRRQPVQPKVHDLAELLRNMALLLQRVIGEHVDLNVRCGSEPCRILADPHQIEQVLMNLVVNAKDAMPRGGTLDIECGLLPEPLERDNLEPLGVLLEVRDTGVGMEDSVKAQIFEPFFTSKGKGKGTGLGLSTVYGVVSQAGGEIDVQSEPGRGSRFRVYFPQAAGEVEKLPHAVDPVPSVGLLETVLLVEDEPSVRTLAETVLMNLGYTVLVADSAAAALTIWKDRRDAIDILLTDVIMPHMSGGELAHQLRAENPRLKILFMSGYTDDMLASHGVLAGETQLLPKPFSPEALGRKLRDVLDS
jgi:two-component system, cell cycle sensor histidine kinase and response regulator CckA